MPFGKYFAARRQVSPRAGSIFRQRIAGLHEINGKGAFLSLAIGHDSRTRMPDSFRKIGWQIGFVARSSIQPQASVRMRRPPSDQIGADGRVPTGPHSAATRCGRASKTVRSTLWRLCEVRRISDVVRVTKRICGESRAILEDVFCAA